jgi:hypothetical protein
MSLATQFAGAVAHAQFHELHDLAHKLWKAHSAGHLADDQAQELAERIEAKKPKRQAAEPTSFQPLKAKRPRQRSPDKARSIARRRRLAKYAPIPPELVEHFTTCELAVIYIIVDEILLHGRCSLFIALIAARAGTCDTIVRDAIHKARDKSLLWKEERRRAGQKSQTNIIRIVNRQWGDWLRKVWNPRRKPTWHSPEASPKSPGYRKTRSTEDKIQKEGNARGVDRSGEALSDNGRGAGSSERSEVSRA